MLRLIPLLALSTPLTAQNVWIVDQLLGPGTTHLDIPAAVAIAADGDTVLVRPGSYSSFAIDGKGLVVTTDATAFPHVTGPITVRNVPAGSAVVLRGLESSPGPVADHGLVVDDCAGAVWVEKCTFAGSSGMKTNAAHVSSSDHVSFARCTLFGGNGTSGGGAGWSGGSGVAAEGSRVVLYECEVHAGNGSWGDDIGGFGGHGLSLWNGSTGFAAGCHFDAGDGGGADDDYDIFSGQLQCGFCGPGGSGVNVADPASHATLLDNVYLPGAGGISTSAKGCPNGSAGESIQDYFGVAAQLTGEARGFRVGSPRREGETTGLIFEGQPGDLAFALASSAHGFAVLPGYYGTLLLDPALAVLPMGAVPAGGVLQVTLTVPPMADPAKLANTILAQSLFVTSALEVRLGPHSELTVLDASL